MNTPSWNIGNKPEKEFSLHFLLFNTFWNIKSQPQDLNEEKKTNKVIYIFFFFKKNKHFGLLGGSRETVQKIVKGYKYLENCWFKKIFVWNFISSNSEPKYGNQILPKANNEGANQDLPFLSRTLK